MGGCPPRRPPTRLFAEAFLASAGAARLPPTFFQMNPNLLVILLMPLAMLAGCGGREVVYSNGSEFLKYTTDAMNTKAGEATVTRTLKDGSSITVTLRNYDTQSQGLNVAEKALDVAGKVVGKR